MSVCFVSGHCDISPEEFATHYTPRIDEAMRLGHRFVVGDARGADTMAQECLAQRGGAATVYHVSLSPRNNVGNFPTVGGFGTDSQRDAALTAASDYDLAWVRSVEEQKALYGASYRRRTSGTEKNLKRRRAQRKRFRLVCPAGG